MSVSFEIGNKVCCRNQIWEIIKIDEHKNKTWIVRMIPEEGGKPQSFLYPLTSIEPIKTAVEQLQKGHLDHIDHYRLLTNATRLSLVYEYDKLLSISNSKMTPEAYQLLAVKKVMESLQQRFLIADDVGLGKTIEAGLIMQELTARHRGERVLIVVPASLQDQWKKEMQNHFLRKFYIYNRYKMEGIQELIDENLNPWLARNSIITSIDWIKPQYQGTGVSKRNTNKVFDQLLKLHKRWDLVIIDEAHYVSTDSNRADFAKAIIEKCDNLILLTATPHSGNPEYFFKLLNLVDPYLFSSTEDLDREDARERVDKIMIRRGKETIFELNKQGKLVNKFQDRQPYSIEVQFSEEEKELYNEVSQYTSESWSKLMRKRKISTNEKNIGRFILTLVQKRMVSSLAALKETLQRRIESIVENRLPEKLKTRNHSEIKALLKEYKNPENMEDEERELIEEYISTKRIQAGHAKKTNEVKILQQILEKTTRLIKQKQDSKLQWLVEFLQDLFAKNPKEKVIIFTEYLDTLNYLKQKINELWIVGKDAIVVIHGGMPLGENSYESGSKLEAERKFNTSQTKILLATDAASEGLNLQRYCHIMVNYELPWNPNRLEQRIGRIHRYGQKHIAKIYNLMIAGTKEAEIFKILQTKIAIIRKQLGNMAEVLGVLEKLSIEELMLRVLDNSVTAKDIDQIAQEELKKIEKTAKALSETQFLSGCRMFTEKEITAAQEAIEDSQKSIPQHKDVQDFVETFLRVFGDQGKKENNGTQLHATADLGVYKIYVPSVLQDHRLPKVYNRATFTRQIATQDWEEEKTPEFIAFGHTLIERMVYFCRVTKMTELGGKISYITSDYHGLPGIIFNFILRFEDQLGKIVREELEPIFIDEQGHIEEDLGKSLFLAPSLDRPPKKDVVDRIREKVSYLQNQVQQHIISKYQNYYSRVEKKRNEEINLILQDLERFNQNRSNEIKQRMYETTNNQEILSDQNVFDFFELDTTAKAKKTRFEKQLEVHEYNVREKRKNIEKMRLGAFPAPDLLNMIVVIPA